MKGLRQILIETYQLLLEYDQDLTWKQHGKKIIDATHEKWHIGRPHPVVNRAMGAPSVGTKFAEHDYNSPEAHERLKTHIMKHIEDTDPTPNKKYVQHIARMYGNSSFSGDNAMEFEDLHSRMKPALKHFHDLSTRKILPPEHRDIGKIKSLRQLEDTIEPYKEKESSRAEDKAHHEKMKKQATITKHPDFTHIIPHTAEAAAHFGKGTRWCTAGTDDPEEQERTFHDYNSDGPLQIMIPKKPGYAGEKYQYHYSSGQTMNEKDHEVDHGELRKRHEGIGSHVQQYQIMADAHKKTLAGLDHPEASVRKHVIMNHPKVSDKQFLDALHNPEKFDKEYEGGDTSLWSSSKIRPEHVMDVIKNGTPDARAHMGYSMEEAHMTNSGKHNFGDKITTDHTQAVIDKGPVFHSKDKEPYISSSGNYLFHDKREDSLAHVVARSWPMTPDQKMEAIKGEGVFQNVGSFGHRTDMTPEDVDNVINHGSSRVKSFFVHNSAYATNNAHRLIHNSDDDVKMSMLDSYHVPVHIKKDLRANYPHVDKLHREKNPFKYEGGRDPDLPHGYKS